MQRPFKLPDMVPIALPKGPAHYWRIMQSMKDGFTVADIAGCTNGVAYRTVKNYIDALRRQGEIEIDKTICKIGAAHVYRCVARKRAAPVARRDSYTGERGKIQDRLWQTMRRMRDFSIAELCYTAAAADMEIEPRTAQTYVRRLRDAGMIETVQPHRKGAPGRAGARAGRYRLKPTCNTGPKPPKIFRAEIVFDANREKIVGAPVTEAVR